MILDFYIRSQKFRTTSLNPTVIEWVAVWATYLSVLSKTSKSIPIKAMSGAYTTLSMLREDLTPLIASRYRSLISRYVLNPYWNWFVTLWPLSVAPNTVSHRIKLFGGELFRRVDLFSF